MHRINVIIIGLFVSITGSFAQIKPEILQPGKISNNGVFGYTLSPDGQEAFWVHSNGGRDTLQLMHARKVNGDWQKAGFATFSGNYKWKDIDPMFSPDGNKILFQSTRPVPGQVDREGFDIWAVDRTKTGWGEPYHLGEGINTDESESFASITSSGNIYFMKRSGEQNNSDIWMSKPVDGKYQTPENIGTPINTLFRESNPFIAADESFIIYFSSDTTGFGQVDLYISFREDGKWTSPVNLGENINTSDAEFCPAYHASEKRLYFSRIVRGGPRNIENIFSVSFDPSEYRKR
ncbi:MAG TPA: hypothetical protein VD927_19160 [Chryseosolibacter sp.]|nr:hypothetical protein [Chryseosolibacter sp.]